MKSILFVPASYILSVLAFAGILLLSGLLCVTLDHVSGGWATTTGVNNIVSIVAVVLSYTILSSVLSKLFGNNSINKIAILIATGLVALHTIGNTLLGLSEVAQAGVGDDPSLLMMFGGAIAVTYATYSSTSTDEVKQT